MIKQAIEQATKNLPIYWPLQSFIASNPLWDLHEHTFQEAANVIKKFTPLMGVMPFDFYRKHYEHDTILKQDIAQAINDYNKNHSTPRHNVAATLEWLYSKAHNEIGVNDQASQDTNSTVKVDILRFLMAYFNNEQSLLAASRENGLYHCWRQLIAQHDNILNDIVIKLSDEKFVAIEQLLYSLGVKSVEHENYLSNLYFQVLGWSSLIKWLEQRPNNPFIKYKASLIDLALIWLCHEKKYGHQCNNANFSNPILESDSWIYSLIWQRAYEYSYERKLLEKLNCTTQPNNMQTNRPILAQAVFCIDTRSEGIRRHLEAIGHYDTYGFAGFFGFVFEYEQPACHTLQCPALFPPEVRLQAENVITTWQTQPTDYVESMKKAKKSFLGSFVLVEITGVYYAWVMMLKSFLPGIFKKLKKFLWLDKQTKIENPVISATQVKKAFSLNAKIINSANFLKTIGLTHHFSSLVLICGHGAETDNNPYQASFDCGACGGNAGYLNAIVVCHILNNPDVRSGLLAHNIFIPETTIFIAGFHNTTRDYIVLHEQDIPSKYTHALASFKDDLKSATNCLRAERQHDLPGGFTPDNRSMHWAELIPEMGLINNATLIIGPRQLTKHCSLDRRAFLHSYDPHNDPEGQLLTGILYGPLIVAHWINMQYYFSTTDPNIYGSGNKMLHNVMSNIGVIEGNLSDLKWGLPWQSIAFRDHVLHEPLRLLVIIYASKQLIETLLSKHPTINSLFSGQWAHLKIIEPDE